MEWATKLKSQRIFKGDKWTRLYGSKVGAIVEVIKFYPKRRVLIKYNNEVIGTMLWCLAKIKKVSQAIRKEEK